MAQFLQDSFCNLGTCYGISQSMVVILQVEADVSGYGIQTVVGQSGKNFAGAPTGTVKFVVRIVHSIVHEYASQTPLIERTVVSDQWQSFDPWGYSLPDHGEGIGVGRVVIGQSVYLRGPAAEVVWSRTYQLVNRVCYLEVFYDYDPDTAYALPVFVGCFEVYCGKIIHLESIVSAKVRIMCAKWRLRRRFL